MLKPKKYAGKPVAMAGIYSGMPMSIYHSATAAVEPSISSSGLRTIFTESPRHYFAESPYNPKRIESDETAALVLGRAAHHLLFGQDDFKREFAVRPETLGGEKWNGNRTTCKLWLEDRAQEGRTVITPAQLETITGMAESLSQEPLVRAGILNGAIEMSWFTKHQATGIWLKSRPDASPNDSLDVCDLKTCVSTDWGDVQNSVYKFGYYIQAGVLAIVARELLNQPLNSYTLLFIEKTPPYDTAIMTLKENDIARGIAAAEHSIRRFADGLKTGVWPGRSGGQADARYVEMKEYAQKQIDARLEREVV